MVLDKEAQTAISRGALVGANAWIVGYILTLGLAAASVRGSSNYQQLESSAGGSVIVDMAGMLFYNAHNVPIVVPQYDVLQFLDPRHNFILDTGGPAFILLVIPPLVLILGGALLTKLLDGPLKSPTDGALTGSALIVGYLPLTVLGALWFGIDPGQGAMQPDLFFAIGFAGAFYPLIFGGIGGAAAYLTSDPSVETVADPNRS